MKTHYHTCLWCEVRHPVPDADCGLEPGDPCPVVCDYCGPDCQAHTPDLEGSRRGKMQPAKGKAKSGR